MNASLAIGGVILAVGLLCIVVGVLLYRRGSGWGTALLVIVPLALIIGGYLAYRGATAARAATTPGEPRNPVPADAASLARGQALYAQNCVICHGVAGRGDGVQAATLNPRPPDLTQVHTAYHSDGYLFNGITSGFANTAMVPWGTTLTANDRWDLVNYLRQFNRLTANGATPPPFNQLPSASPSR